MYYYKDECFFQHQDISFSRYKYVKGTYEHKHDFFEIAYVMDGKGYHYVDSECMEIKKGDYMILDTTVTHRYEGVLEIANVIFHPRIIDATYRDVRAAEELYNLITINSGYSIIIHEPVYHIFRDDDGSVKEKLLYIKDEIENKRLGYIECARASLVNVLMRSLRSICYENVSESGNCPIKYIEKYIYEHYDENISLTQLCDELGYSVSYISKRFKSLTGRSFSDYLKRTRIQFACSIIMKNPAMSVEDIALGVGYSDTKYFTELFKKYMGKTPAVFKRLYKYSK